MRLLSRWLLGAVCALTVGGFGSAALAAMDCGMNSGQKATGEPIPIGAIMTASGAADISGGTMGTKAYFDCVNDNGGINGRPIAYSMEDDQTRPDKAAEIAKKLVEDKKVYALVGSSSLVDCIATAQYYQDQGVISLMAGGVAPQCFNARNIAPVNAGPRYSLVGVAKYAMEQLGTKHIACPQPTVPGADWSCNGIKALAEQHNVEYSVFTFDQQSADNDSLIQQILQTGADTTIYFGSPPTIAPFLAAAERADVRDKLKILMPATVYLPDVPKTVGSYWNDHFWVNLEFGPTDVDEPDTQNYLAVMKAYNTPIGALGQGGYLAARMLVQALLKLDPAKIDRAAVTEAIQGIQDYKSDMLCGAWSFGAKDATARLGNRAGYIAEITNDDWKVLPGCVAIDDSLISN